MSTPEMTRIPTTIGELQAFCDAHHMPLEKMRFFIGKDYKGARAFGIYQNQQGNFVVYKNKSDGTRAVRYEGPDEKKAVREIYDKLKAETLQRRGTASLNRSGGGGLPASPRDIPKMLLGGLMAFWAPILVVIVAVAGIVSVVRSPNRGYYTYRDDTYYYQDGYWYAYNTDKEQWEHNYAVPDELEDNYREYFDGTAYDEGIEATDFTQSGYFQEDNDYDDDDYDAFDWGDDDDDWDDWDAGDTDWDTDW